MTLYAACLRRLGLSLAEAAALHNVRRDTVASWSNGRNRPPAGAWDDLRRLEAAVIDRSEAMRARWADVRADVAIGLRDADLAGTLAAADFVLNLPAGVAVTDEETEAVLAARRARQGI
ncbi:MAG: hypothetical protein KGQ52_13420 [Alphaproteobacteria bacterium]|nr:hypothetical protein [Alphaproteobacteria bacterium]